MRKESSVGRAWSVGWACAYPRSIKATNAKQNLIMRRTVGLGPMCMKRGPPVPDRTPDPCVKSMLRSRWVRSAKNWISIAASDNTIMSRENFAARQLQGQCGQQQGGPFGEKPCACAACPPPLGFVLPKIGSGLNWICRHNQESRIWGGRGPIDDERHRKEPVEGWAFGASTGMRDLSTAWVRSAKSWI